MASVVLNEIFTNVNEIWIAVGAIFLVYFIGLLMRRSKKSYPPGPMGIPIVGYLPFLTSNPHLKLMELSKRYGEVFSLRLGSVNVVVLNGTASIREAFTKHEFLGRPPHSAFVLFNSLSPFFLCDLNLWQQQRKFVIQSMKNLGLGKSKIEVNIQDEINHFQEVLRQSEGKPMDLLRPLTPSMSNNICSLIFGKRYKYADPERIELDENLDYAAKGIGQTAFHIFFPWIRHFPFLLKLLTYDKSVAAFKKNDDIFRKQIEEHKETLDPKDARDFIDSYLIEMKNRTEKDLENTFTESTLAANVSDLFGAGSETVRTSIAWCVYIMAAYPDVQKKVQNEIMDVLGPDRFPEFQDQKSMPVTVATIHEIMRWKTIVPLNLLRYTIDDTSVCGYKIPRNTTILANLWAVHHDSNNWKEPDEFIPERFLSPDGESVVKSTNFMPFSVGKRVCPGETMAFMEIFLYFVSLLQNFDIKFPDGVEPNFDAELTITYKLKPFRICFIPKK